MADLLDKGKKAAPAGQASVRPADPSRIPEPGGNVPGGPAVSAISGRPASTANPGQAEAIAHRDGPMLVLAGPGSGKTYTITQRVRCLIEEGGAEPDSILVITFTRAAADEM